MAADNKFHWNGEHFQNRVSGEIIPDDEPVIIFRARDWHAIAVLNRYRALINDPHHILALDYKIHEFMKFKEEHPERMKEPGITRDIII